MGQWGPCRPVVGAVCAAAGATEKGDRESEWSPAGLGWCFPNSPLLRPSVLDAKDLARSFFNQLWEVCSQWQKQVPLNAWVPQRQWLVSIHAIRNTRRKMEDRHVCLPAFNQLFGLSVSAPPAVLHLPVPTQNSKKAWCRGWGRPGLTAELPARAEAGVMAATVI